MTDVRLIDADKYPCQTCNVSHCYQNCEKFVEWFNNTVDAVPVVHGRWVGTQYDGYADGFPVYDLWECSECREEYESEGDPPPYNYCPNCGAKMDLEV